MDNTHPKDKASDHSWKSVQVHFEKSGRTATVELLEEGIAFRSGDCDGLMMQWPDEALPVTPHADS